VVQTIRPDTIFIPYHWADDRSVNRLTHRTLDPRSKIPEFKVSACRIRKADAAPEWSRDEELVDIKLPPGVPLPKGARE
jgi:predicted molibdopterin-dependent oxidoreductase YjgC